jgi:hypothetical protein
LDGLPTIHIAGCLWVFVFFCGRGRNLPDGVAGAQTNPLRDGAVLTLSFGKLLLGAESLVALYNGKIGGLVARFKNSGRRGYGRDDR